MSDFAMGVSLGLKPSGGKVSPLFSKKKYLLKIFGVTNIWESVFPVHIVVAGDYLSKEKVVVMGDGQKDSFNHMNEQMYGMSRPRP